MVFFFFFFSLIVNPLTLYRESLGARISWCTVVYLSGNLFVFVFSTIFQCFMYFSILLYGEERQSHISFSSIAPPPPHTHILLIQILHITNHNGQITRILHKSVTSLASHTQFRAAHHHHSNLGIRNTKDRSKKKREGAYPSTPCHWMKLLRVFWPPSWMVAEW